MRANGLHVLLVEDDASIAELFRKALQRNGHVVTVVGSSTDAVATLSSGKCVDRLVCDWRLADGTAQPVLETFLEQCPETKRIVVSGDVLDKPIGIESIVDLWLRKPLSLEEFCAGVERGRSKRSL